MPLSDDARTGADRLSPLAPGAWGVRVHPDRRCSNGTTCRRSCGARWIVWSPSRCCSPPAGWSCAAGVRSAPRSAGCPPGRARPTPPASRGDGSARCGTSSRLFISAALFVIYIVEGASVHRRLDHLDSQSVLLIGLVIALRYVEGKAARRAVARRRRRDRGRSGGSGSRGGAAPAALRAAAHRLRIAIVAVAVLTFLQVWGLGTWTGCSLTEAVPAQRFDADHRGRRP